MRNANEIRQYVQHWTKSEPSPAALRVAALLEEWCRLHHLDDSAMRKVDWANTVYVDLRLGMTRLSTFDFTDLTALVFLAHDHCIRVEIRPCNNSHVKILFHPRHAREGGMVQRHPTLEEAVAGWRQNHASRPLPKEPQPC